MRDVGLALIGDVDLRSGLILVHQMAEVLQRHQLLGIAGDQMRSVGKMECGGAEYMTWATRGIYPISKI